MLTQVKAVNKSSRAFEGYLIPFGSPDDLDLDEEYFSSKTAATREWFDLLGALPVMFQHERARELFEAQGITLPAELPIEGPVGKITTWKTDNVGHFVQGIIEAVDKSREWYANLIYDLLEKGTLNFSSGALPQRVKPPAKDGFIPVWPVIEASLTPTPANPKHTIVAPIKSVKSAIDQIGLDSSKLDSLLDEGDGELPADTDGKLGKSGKAESVHEHSERVAMAFQAQESVRAQMTQMQPAYMVDMLMDKTCVVNRGRDHYKVAYTEADDGQITFANPDSWMPVKREWVPIEKMDMPHADMDDAQKRALALLELADLTRLI